MHDQRHAHDFRIDDNGVRSASEFACGIAVIGCDDDDAVIVQSMFLEPRNKSADTSIDLVDLQRQLMVKPRLRRPISLVRLGQAVSRKLVDVLWLSVEKDRSGIVCAMRKNILGFLYR